MTIVSWFPFAPKQHPVRVSGFGDPLFLLQPLQQVGLLFGFEANGLGRSGQKAESERGFAQLIDAVRAGSRNVLGDLPPFFPFERSKEKQFVKIF